MERGEPRFHNKQELPKVPEGMELYKFYGEPVCIPARAEGEPLVGKTTYTARQIARISELSQERGREIARAEQAKIESLVSDLKEFNSNLRLGGDYHE